MMKMSERYDEIIGWNEDDGTAHIRNDVIKLEEENVLLQNIREAQAAMINKLFAEKQEPVDALLADTTPEDIPISDIPASP